MTFTKNRNIKVKHKIDGKINLYSHSSDCGLENFYTVDKEGPKTQGLQRQKTEE